jgi:chemotaxis response regulator CheB
VIPDAIMSTKMKIIHVIIVSRPGTFQRLLQNDVDSYPFVEVVAVAHSSLSAVQLVKEYRPDLLLIDSSIPIEDITSIVYNVDLENLSVLVMVIGDKHQQQRAFNKAGANFVVSTYEFKT